MDGLAKALPIYCSILNREAKPRFRKLKGFLVDFDDDGSLSELLAQHLLSMRAFRTGERGTGGRGTNLLELKCALAARILDSCNLCERRCEAARSSGQKGRCGVLEARISSEFLHFGEEPELVPSYTIFFAGCTFECVFCQNNDISQNPKHGSSS